MRTRRIFALCCLSAAASLLRGDTIDRIAVSVGNRVITASDLDREIRVTAFLGGEPLDFSPEVKRATAARMVEQKLIQRELETARYPVPSRDSIEPALADFKKRLYASDQQYREALAKYGVTEEDVRDSVLWQRTLLSFVAVRFEPGVQVNAQQVQEYFDKIVTPVAREADPAKPATLEDYRDEIVAKLAGERANEEMVKWLEEARKRTEIVYHDEVFEKQP